MKNLRADIYIILLLFTVAASVAALFYGDVAAIFAVTIGYLSYEIAVSLLFFTLTALGIRKLLREKHSSQTSVSFPKKPFVSIVIAAFNESGCIRDTLQSLFAQKFTGQQIVIASDGSDDGMNELLIKEFDLRNDNENQILWTNDFESSSGEVIKLELLTLPRAGKGAALNAGLVRVEAEIVVTLDADTRLEADAIYELANAFENEKVVAVGGFIYVRDAARGSWIGRYQYVEFLRNFLWRIGLTNFNVCLQVSGAFGAFRTEVLREIGAFDEESLVEDYEIIYRVHEFMRNKKREYEVAMATKAVAYTDSPQTASAFVQQRTRWFTGFLQTLFAYRRMIFSTRFGKIGVLMLPIKTIDAILPIWGFASLVILLVVIIFGRGSLPLWAAMLFLTKYLFDVILISVILRWHRKIFPTRKLELSAAQMVFCVLTEGLLFNQFRQIAVLNAYRQSVRQIKKQKQNRWLTNREKMSLPSPVGFTNEAGKE